MKERFDRSYVALPVSDGPLLAWVRSINKHKPFFHTSVFLLGDIGEDEAEIVKDLFRSRPKMINNLTLIPEKLDIMNRGQKTYVVRLAKTDELMAIREYFESNLPTYTRFDPVFEPHISIKKFRDVVPKNTLLGDVRNRFESYSPQSIGIYYRTDEGATALLFIQRK